MPRDKNAARVRPLGPLEAFQDEKKNETHPTEIASERKHRSPRRDFNPVSARRPRGGEEVPAIPLIEPPPEANADDTKAISARGSGRESNRGSARANAASGEIPNPFVPILPPGPVFASPEQVPSRYPLSARRPHQPSAVEMVSPSHQPMSARDRRVRHGRMGRKNDSMIPGFISDSGESKGVNVEALQSRDKPRQWGEDTPAEPKEKVLFDIGDEKDLPDVIKQDNKHDVEMTTIPVAEVIKDKKDALEKDSTEKDATEKDATEKDATEKDENENRKTEDDESKKREIEKDNEKGDNVEMDGNEKNERYVKGIAVGKKERKKGETKGIPKEDKNEEVTFPVSKDEKTESKYAGIHVDSGPVVHVDSGPGVHVDVEEESGRLTICMSLHGCRNLAINLPKEFKSRPRVYAIVGFRSTQANTFEMTFEKPLRYGESVSKERVRKHYVEVPPAVEGCIEIQLFVKDPYGGEDTRVGFLQMLPRALRSVDEREFCVKPTGFITISSCYSHDWIWEALGFDSMTRKQQAINETASKAAKEVENTLVVYPDAKGYAGEAWEKEEERLTHEIVKVGTVEVDDVIRQHEKDTKERIKQVSIEVAEQHKIMEKLAEEEDQCRERVVKARKRNDSLLEKEESALIEKVALRSKKAQEHQRRVIDTLQRSIKVVDGRLETGWKQEVSIKVREEKKTEVAASVDRTGVPRVRWFKAHWEGAPTVLTLRIDELRALKDKVTPGRYVVLVTLWSRLGGKPVKYKGKGLKKTHLWTGCTPKPQRHYGRYYDLSLSFGQPGNEVHIAVPPKREAKPGMVLVFELIQLRGRHTKMDKCVAWGAFPVFSSSFEPIDGRFKVSLLRGEIDKHIDRHEMIDERISSDLDHWMCNCYFATKRQSRFEGMMEETVEIVENIQRIVRRDKHDPLDLGKSRDSRASMHRKLSDGSGQSNSGVHSNRRMPVGSPLRMQIEKPMPDMKSSAENALTNSNMDEKIDMADEKHVRPDAKINTEDDMSADELLNSEIDESNKKVIDLPLLRLIYGPPRALNVFNAAEKVGIINETNKFKHPLGVAGTKRITHDKHISELDTFNASVRAKNADEGNLKRRMIYESFIEDLYPQSGSSLNCSQMLAYIFLWAVMLWSRIYVHYGGEWMMISAMRVSVYNFDFKWYTMNFVYNYDIIGPVHIVGIISCGWLANMALFSMFLVVLLTIKCLVGFYPIWISFAMLVYGIVMILDPLLIAAVDVFDGNTEQGDIFKLYTFYYKYEGNGLTGIFLTVIVYSVLLVLAVSTYYLYILYAHKAGRILDVYQRLCRQDNQLFFPKDQEISMRTLKRVSARAKKFTSSDGTVRKVFSQHYVVHDHLNKRKKETTVHITIFNVNIAGDRTLHRQFIRVYNGTIIEVFERMPSIYQSGLRIFNKQVKQRKKAMPKPRVIKPKAKREEKTKFGTRSGREGKGMFTVIPEIKEEDFGDEKHGSPPEQYSIMVS